MIGSSGPGGDVVACRFREVTRLVTGSCLCGHPPDGRRAFCRVCGSKAPLSLLGDTIVIVPAGVLDGDPGVRPVLHQFAGSKACWWEIADALPRFEKWVPGYEPARARPR